MSNTIIQIKRSDTTSQPANLSAGEFAYSYLSNTLFLGTTDGTGVVNVGGLLYTQTIDAATSANTGSTLVKRRSDGAFFGQLFGNANTATALQTGRSIGITGGDVVANSVSFDGTTAINIAVALSSMANLTAGQYGSTTQVPVITVSSNGRVSNIHTASIATSITISGNTGSGTQAGGGTLTLQGGNTGIVTTVTGSGGSETVTISTDNTVVRSNTTVGGTQIINTPLKVGNDLTVQGNLNVLGTSSTINVSNFVVNDPLIFLAGNNFTSDTVDIGFIGSYNDGANAHTGLFRDPNLKEYIFFKNYTTEISGNNLINIADPTFAYSNVRGDYFKGNLIANQATSDGFYGKTTDNLLKLYPSSSYTSGNQYIIVDPTAPNHIHLRAGGTIDSSNAELFLGGENTGVQVSDAAKVTYINANGKSSSFNADGTVTLFGKVTAAGLNLNDFSQAAFNKANSSIFNAGGDLTVGTMLIGAGGNTLTTLANTGTAGTYANASHVPVITTDAYGRISSVTSTAIAINTSQVTSGTLGYGRGGTGSTSYTTGALLVAGASGLQSLANSSYTLTGALQANNTVTSLTVDVYGRVTAATGAAISGLTVPQGGTGLSSVTTNGITYGNGAGNLGVTAAAGSSDQTWTNQLLTVTDAGVPVWSSRLDGGRF
jgi:hypothetical protein